jgi:hypothetical protein|tara:strand:- start:1219 stop:1335 length:117 start_codon:yes stop_codon:yes gene_type:complete
MKIKFEVELDTDRQEDNELLEQILELVERVKELPEEGN